MAKYLHADYTPYDRCNYLSMHGLNLLLMRYQSVRGPIFFFFFFAGLETAIWGVKLDMQARVAFVNVTNRLSSHGNISNRILSLQNIISVMPKYVYKVLLVFW